MMNTKNILDSEKTTTVSDTDSFLLDQGGKLKEIDYGKLADAILNKLTSKAFTLDQGSKTLVAALNELNSKSFISKRIGKIEKKTNRHRI